MFKCLNVKMNKGFTLVEMLITALVFSIIVGVATGLFISAIRLQRYNLTYQRLLDQTSYAIEYMARAIRMAKRNDGGVCSPPMVNENYYPDSGDNIRFVTYHDECWKFFLEVEADDRGQFGKLKIDKDGIGGDPPYALTSDDFDVENFNVYVSGDISGEQPKVTIFMGIKGRGSGYQPKIQIQTTVSQRNLNK